MAFEFFKFLSWTALWAWVLSDTAFRYVIPKIDKFYDTLDKIAKTNTREGVFRFLLVKTIVMFIRLFAIICLTYVMASWSAWCALRCVLYIKGLETGRWLFFISGFYVACLLSTKRQKFLPVRTLSVHFHISWQWGHLLSSR